MKNVRMVKLMAGPDGVFHPGQVVLVDDKTADQLVKSHSAEVVAGKSVSKKSERVEETATLEAPEQAVKPAPKRRQVAKK